MTTARRVGPKARGGLAVPPPSEGEIKEGEDNDRCAVPPSLSPLLQRRGEANPPLPIESPPDGESGSRLAIGTSGDCQYIFYSLK